MNPRRSLEAAADLGRRRGLGVRETDFRDLDGTVVVNLTAAGEWIEVHFREHPATGYLRFDRGYVHLDHGEATAAARTVKTAVRGELDRRIAEIRARWAAKRHQPAA